MKSLKSLQQFNQVILIMEENMVVIRDPKTFYFNFDCPKVDDNLMHETEYIIKSNESLAENKIKHDNDNDNDDGQLFLWYG